uniref:CAP10 domain-containing protein n=1 Tax=Ascaris lumbricoides TaxID=6252 RepID=A0A0M3IP81_ASCLU
MLLAASAHGVRYQLIGGRLFRQPQCPFEARAAKRIEWAHRKPIAFFRGSRTNTLRDRLILLSRRLPNLIDAKYTKNQAWSVIFRTLLVSNQPASCLLKTTAVTSRFLNIWAAKRIEWAHRKPIAFFRGSRTNTLRDRLILLSRRLPNLIDAKYTKNQAWRKRYFQDTLGEQPASELSFEDHCSYKSVFKYMDLLGLLIVLLNVVVEMYLFNFAGVAASFRLRHLLLCGSPVFNVGHQWIEFFYGALYPWIHFVEVAEEMNNVEELLRFAHEHDDIMHRIGTRGRAFVESHLRMEDVLCYWRQLLTQYSRLITYRIRRVPSFKRII